MKQLWDQHFENGVKWFVIIAISRRPCSASHYRKEEACCLGQEIHFHGFACFRYPDMCERVRAEHVLCILHMCSSSQIKRTPHPFHSLDIPFCLAFLHNISHALGRSCDLWLLFFCNSWWKWSHHGPHKDERRQCYLQRSGIRWISSKHDPSEVGHESLVKILWWLHLQKGIFTLGTLQQI